MIADLDQGGPVLEVGTLARAPDIYRCDDGDHDDGEDGLAKRGEGNDFSEVFGESAGQSSDGTARNDEKQAPAVEKSRDAAEPITNKTIESAGLGICGGELGISECAEKRESASDDPDKERVADRTV